MTDEHLLDETETAILMELQDCRIGDVVAEWEIHGYRFQLAREDENQFRHGREQQRRYQRKLRLYEHRQDPITGSWFPSIGGQWHDSIRSGYERARFVADCYHSSDLKKQRNDRAKEMRRIADELRPRYIREMN